MIAAERAAAGGDGIPAAPAADAGARQAPDGEVPAGSQADFELCYATNFERLIVQLYAYTGDMAQAQDVVQEAFARALPRWEKLATYDDPVAWIRRVALNLASSRWRQLRVFRRFASRHQERHVDGPTPDRVALTAALEALSANPRRAIVLHYLADMAVADIAREMGVADGTVKSWLHRGRAALAAMLTETLGEEACDA